LTDIVRLEPNPTNKCFGCGGDNPGGMKLTFEQDNVNRRIIGRFVLGERYQGGGGFGHGGIIAVLLDEAMGKVCRFREVRAVTAELTVEYLKPVNVQQEIIVEGRETEQKGRKHFYERGNSRYGWHGAGEGQGAVCDYRAEVKTN